ncbi:MAG: glutathione S-transferase N-terminal domain-containing protein [Acetobacteraceae bacterium]|nr:glutathione S-transferase N-terminal domain-containing protein [Acetobacteraceae bacterium]
MLTLFYTPETCALATHIALEEAGADYTLRRIDFERQEQRSPGYLEVNPKGRVPALATPRGVLTETPALLGFVAQSFPAAQLAPVDDPFAFARLQDFNNYLCSTVHVAHAHRMRGHRWVDDEAAIEAMRRRVPQSVHDAFRVIEEGMLAGPWVMGEAYTVADPYLFTLARWLERDGVDPARLPRIAEHRRRMAERPAAQRALAAEA